MPIVNDFTAIALRLAELRGDKAKPRIFQEATQFINEYLKPLPAEFFRQPTQYDMSGWMDC